MSGNIVINVPPLIINITPFGFHHYANEYFVAGQNWVGNNGYSPVPYFLYCRAIELGLKAFLLAKGEKLDWVKDKLRHDLTKALNRARANSLDHLVKTTELEVNEILIANKYYKSKGFEYFYVVNHMKGLKGLPNLDVLRDYSKKLLSDIKIITDNSDIE